MKKSNIIKPIGLKGQESLNRMKELMGETIDRTSTNSVVEITKEGPDGKIYGVVRENHQYFVKIADKKDNLLSEDFKYIGGLQNKKDFAFTSYANAIKRLNLKFISLNEAYDSKKQINVFINDNLLNEHHGMNPEASMSATKGVGDNDEYIEKGKGKKLDYKSPEDKETSGDNLADGKTENEWDEVTLTETEADIDAMITGEPEEDTVKETKKGFSIARAVNEMSAIVDEVCESEIKVSGLLEGLSDSEKELMFSILKKKA